MAEDTPHQPIKNISSTAQCRLFRIELSSRVDQEWMAAFDPLSFTNSEGLTSFEVLADQAALRGILNRLWDLNLDIHSVIEITLTTVSSGGN